MLLSVVSSTQGYSTQGFYWLSIYFTFSCSFSNLSELTSCVLVLSFVVRASLLLWNQGNIIIVMQRANASLAFYKTLKVTNVLFRLSWLKPGLREHQPYDKLAHQPFRSHKSAPSRKIRCFRKLSKHPKNFRLLLSNQAHNEHSKSYKFTYVVWLQLHKCKNLERTTENIEKTMSSWKKDRYSKKTIQRNRKCTTEWK